MQTVSRKKLNLRRLRMRAFSKRDSLQEKISLHESEHPFDQAPSEPFIENLDEVFQEFTRTIGGTVPLDSLIGQSTIPKSADAVFADEKLIVELKTLEVGLSDATIFKTLEEICESAEVSMTECVPFLANSQPLPIDIQSEVYRRIRKRIRASIKDARKQLVATRMTASSGQLKTCLIVANSGITMFPQSMLLNTIAAEMHRENHWADIDGLVYWSGNVFYRSRASSRSNTIWIPAYRNDETKMRFDGSLDRLGTKFLMFLSHRAGEQKQAPLFLDPSEAFQLLDRSKSYRPRLRRPKKKRRRGE
jgi:hypothetical protein